jgi:hypothetical protein
MTLTAKKARHLADLARSTMARPAPRRVSQLGIDLAEANCWDQISENQELCTFFALYGYRRGRCRLYLYTEVHIPAPNVHI